MLKLSIKNPTTQETETYDVATEFNQFFNQAKEYGLINSIFSLRVNAMRDENAPIRLHADSDVGNGLLSILDGDDSLYDVRVMRSNPRPSFQTVGLTFDRRAELPCQTP